MADLVLKAAVKGVASGIGLVSEGIHHHKERKLAKAHLTEVSEEEIRPADGHLGKGNQHADVEEGDEGK